MITVRSIRGDAVQVGSFLPTTVRKIATLAAVDLGYHADGLYTLADAEGTALQYDDPAPEHGEYELVDVGGAI